jgi:hypothetical protein
MNDPATQCGRGHRAVGSFCILLLFYLLLCDGRVAPAHLNITTPLPTLFQFCHLILPLQSGSRFIRIFVSTLL